MANKTYYLPDIVAHFKQNGLKLLGKGYHAAVFQAKNTSEVVKVFKNDPCYTMFLYMIAENPSIHFPKIKSYVALRGVYESFHIVKMERLESKLEDLGEDRDLLLNMIGVSRCYRNITIKHDINHTNFRLQNTFKSFIDENASLCDALKILASYPKRTICEYDLKSENIMRRADGTIVIIDPFAAF